MEKENTGEMGDLEAVVASTSAEEKPQGGVDPMEALAQEMEAEGPAMDEGAHLAGGDEEGSEGTVEPALSDAVLDEVAGEEKDTYEGNDIPGTVIEEAAKDAPTGEASIAQPEEKFREDRVEQGQPVLKASKRPTFDPSGIQNALKDDEDNEGGIVASSNKGASTKTSVEGGGGIIKPAPDMFEDSVEGKFEVTGFQASFENNGEMTSVNIRDYFDDIDTAKASVNGSKYLMPLPNGGFKVTTIVGSPTISYNERQIFCFKNGEWSRS